MAAQEYPSEVKAIMSKVEKWLENIQYTLELTLTEPQQGVGLKEQDFPGASKLGPFFTHHSGSAEGETFISIGFSKKVSPDSTVEDLQKSLKYVALDKLPMPGFVIPEGWNVYPRTPVSSFKEGVKIVSFENGRIHFKIDTNFFAVFGNIPDQQPACGRSPPGSYFRVEKDFRGLIDVNMPILYL